MLKDTDEVVKHSAAIQIQNNITLLQRRAWNVLLANAYDELPLEVMHSIKVVDLMEKLEFDSKNDDYLKDALEALVGCKMKWNVLDRDNRWEWGVTTLLAHAIIKNGFCTYSYSPPLRERLHNPNIYARISLSMQNKFDSKHALALWELCLDYLDKTKNCGETPFIPLQKFRELMGIGDDMYPEFKKLNKWVIKDPIEEINEVTDFHVDIEYKRDCRKIVAIKFRMRRVLQLATQTTSEDGAFSVFEDLPALVHELQEVGFSAQDAWDLWYQGTACIESDSRPTDIDFETYVREKIHLLKKQPKGKIKNTAGFLLEAVKKNYTNADFYAVQQAKTTPAHSKSLEKLQHEKEHLESEKQQQIHQLCQQIIYETPEIVDPLLPYIFAEEPFYRQVYDNTKTLLDNYHDHVFFSARLDMQLVQQYPEKFQGIYQVYEQKIADLERKIAAHQSSHLNRREYQSILT
jgi:Initiator Replication protein